MGDEKQGLRIDTDGIHVGDWTLGLVPKTSTDDHLDDPESRERDRQKEADQRAAQHSDGGDATPSTTQAAADVDASIEAARAEQAPAGAALPILLRIPSRGR